MAFGKGVSGGFATLFFCFAAAAAPLQGDKTIYLVDGAGAKSEVGKVSFAPTDSGAGYTIDWQDERFADHFLSMRPFRCLEGEVKYWCRVPFPYEINRTVSADDLTDLEYDTMFIWKGASEYGINMWNGVYYKLRIEDDRLVGRLHEMDMDKLSAPPEAGNLRPVREQDLEPGEPESHWLPVLVIE
ncbi:MAG: hypothetical protein ACR2PF_19615 [Rhizobiaceae bacterium]